MTTAALLQTRAAKSQASRNSIHAGLMLQRKCACGLPTASLTGECAECKSKKRLQKKLALGAVNDPLEREADRVADRALATLSHSAASDAPARIQRYTGPASGQTDTAPASVDRVLASPGRQLDPSLRQKMGQRFGHDFSRVRVHTGAAAERSARDVQANAYTVGRNIVFGAGQFAPGTHAGQRLIAHELAHVVQQSGSEESRAGQDDEKRGQSSFSQLARRGATARLKPGAYSIRLLADDGERLIGPPALDVTGATSAGGAATPPAETGAAEAGAREETRPEELLGQPLQQLQRDNAPWLQRVASFTNPVPTRADPLARLAKGLTPGLTTPTINGSAISNLGDVLKEVYPSQVAQTGYVGGNVQCEFSNFNIGTSCTQIIATPAPAGGWSGNVPPALLGSPAACAQKATIPTRMNALPSNADFVKRVLASENEHRDEIRTLHDRHFVPHDKFITKLRGNGTDLPKCGQNLAAQLNDRPTQAAFAFVYGYQAATEKFDGSGGTHSDDARPNIAAGCASMTLELSQSTPLKKGAAPGNVVPVSPKLTAFNPAKSSVIGTDIKDGNTIIKHFSNAADANAALKVIKHYGMTRRGEIGPLEYFLVGKAAPSGAFAGASELAINPAFYQVTFNSPNAGDWAITEVVGKRINVIANFGAQRDEAYSALALMLGLRFTQKAWIGGKQGAPAMTYFRV